MRFHVLVCRVPDGSPLTRHLGVAEPTFEALVDVALEDRVVLRGWIEPASAFGTALPGLLELGIVRPARARSRRPGWA